MGKVSEFSRKYAIDRNTLTAYLRRHPEIFQGHTERRGRDIIMDETAEMELEKAYHPQIVVNTPDPELIEYQKKTEELYEKIVMFQTEILNKEHEVSEMSRQLIEAETRMKLLENSENDRLQALTKLHEAEVQAAADKVEMEQLRAEIERLKHRSLIQRIFNA